MKPPLIAIISDSRNVFFFILSSSADVSGSFLSVSCAFFVLKSTSPLIGSWSELFSMECIASIIGVSWAHLWILPPLGPPLPYLTRTYYDHGHPIKTNPYKLALNIFQLNKSLIKFGEEWMFECLNVCMLSVRHTVIDDGAEGTIIPSSPQVLDRGPQSGPKV